MPHLEPSYLRYIYDGLDKGELHPDNAAALPDGLTGLYEASFEESKPARERQKLLETFAVWALLKKEVSSQFVAEILEVPTQEIIDFIATYSNWFTSPESGKYQLYHERLKLYLLQKLSEQEIATLHTKLIIRLEQAIAEQNIDEFEIYGLEFLSVHYFTTAIITGDSKKLIGLSYDQNHWQRQLKLSKEFEWTKKGLKQVMTWASKYNDEEVIECGLQMVDLHHQEQNDAPQIIALVAEGDIDTALKRIEAFSGNDKEGLQRKFILYMLCLMELTLLESKDKSFRKEAIEKILKHFDGNIFQDYNFLQWNYLFSSYLFHEMICEWIYLEIDISFLHRYEINFFYTSSDYIKNHNKNKIAILWKFGNQISDDLNLREFSSFLSQYGEYEKSFRIIKKIVSPSKRANAIEEIANAFIKRNNLLKATEIADLIQIDDNRNSIYKKVSIAHVKNEDLSKGIDILKLINDDKIYFETISEISYILTNIKKYNEAKKIIHTIHNKFERKLLKIKNLIILSENENSNIWDLNIEKSVNYLLKIKDSNKFQIYFQELIIGTIRFSEINNAVFLLNLLPDGNLKENYLLTIISELITKNKSDDWKILMSEIFDKEKTSDILKDFTSEFENKLRLNNIINQLINFKKYDDAYNTIMLLKDSDLFINLLAKLLSDYYRYNMVLKINDILENKIMNSEKIILSIETSNNLIKTKHNSLAINVLELAVKETKYEKNTVLKDMYLGKIAEKYAEIGKYEKSLTTTKHQVDRMSKFNTIKKILVIAVKDENVLMFNSLMFEFLKLGFGLEDENLKSIFLEDIALKLLKENNTEDVKKIANSIPYFYSKAKVKSHISIQLAKNGLFEDAIKYSENIKIYMKTNKPKSNDFENYTIFEQEIILKIETLLEIYKISYINRKFNINTDIKILLEILIADIDNAEKRKLYIDKLKAITSENINILDEIANKYSKTKEKEIFVSDVRNEILNIIYSKKKKKINIFLKLEEVLNLVAIDSLFIRNVSEEKIQRYNRTLNIQWAIDIKNQLRN